MSDVASTARGDLILSHLTKSYGDFTAVNDLSLTIPKGSFFALLGPSGCGKTTTLRMIAGLEEPTVGSIHLGSTDITTKRPYQRPINTVFQNYALFPHLTIFENVAFGLRLQGVNSARQLDELVAEALDKAALWQEVKNRLHDNALTLSGGQQQRLVIARAIAIEPEVLLLDEPASALDPISTLKIEELIYELKQHYTIVIVTHNMQQAARVSDYTAFMNLGQLVEFDATNKIFTDPNESQTEDYITGRFG